MNSGIIKPNSGIKNTGSRLRAANELCKPRKGRKMGKNEIPAKTLVLWQLRVAAAAVIITAASAFLCMISVWFLIYAHGTLQRL